MKAITFPQSNFNLAADQGQYNTLPCFAPVNENGVLLTDEKGELIDEQVKMVSCFELSEEEITELVIGRKLYHTQLTFGMPFQGFRIYLGNPFDGKTTARFEHLEAGCELQKDELGVLIDREGKITVTFDLAESDVRYFTKGGKLWYERITEGYPYQPLLMTTLNPFENAEN